MADESNFDNEDFDQSKRTIVTNSDTDINELDKLKTLLNKNVCYRPVLFVKAIGW